MTLVIAPGITDAKPINGDTLLVYLIDRSGSMQTCWEGTIGGLNIDIETQKQADDGKTEAVIYFFDGNRANSRSWDNSSTVTQLVKPFAGPLSEAIVFDQKDVTYRPRGSTPLYDSVGRMITEVEDRVAATAGIVNVIVSIFTDGGNTDYHGHPADEVKRMVEAAQGRGWTFTYFGANQDAWAVGSTLGVSKGNTMSYDTNNMRGMMATASVARSAHVGFAKAASSVGMNYVSEAFFEEAGQTEADYQKK
jgi:hypothetical protein